VSTRIGVVDCTQRSRDDDARNVHAVGNPSDLTGVGIEFSSLYERLAADGLGVCAVDPDVLDDRALSSLAQAFAGRIRLRNDEGETRIRVDGLPGQHDGWQPVNVSE
jgi:hypothetical protein